MIGSRAWRLPSRPEPALLFHVGPSAAHSCTPAGMLGDFDALLPEVRASPSLARAEPHLRSVMRGLPSCRLFAFEIRLSSADTQVDLALRLPGTPLHLAGAAQRLESWRRVAELADRAIRDDSALQAIDLEFDLPDDPGPIPVPRLFLELREGATPKTIRALAQDLAGHEGFSGLLERLRGTLPSGARLIHLGWAFDGPADVLRIVLSGVSADAWSRFLRQVGWPAPTDMLLDQIAALGESRVDLALDLCGDRVARVGFECFPGPRGTGGHGWEPFLASLQSADICRSDRAEELQAWNGTTETGWNGNDTVELARFPSHVKIVQSARGDLSAKGYLGVRRRAR